MGLGSSEGEGELRGPQAPGERGHRPLTCGRGFFTVLVVVVILSVPIIIAVLKWEQVCSGPAGRLVCSLLARGSILGLARRQCLSW